MNFCSECGTQLQLLSIDLVPRCQNENCIKFNKAVVKKDLSDLCIWISEALKEIGYGDIKWRVIMKIAQDFASDNNLEIKLV